MPINNVFKLSGLSPNPDVLYVGTYKRYEESDPVVKRVGMGFGSHQQILPITNKVSSPFFRWCKDCTYRKNYEAGAPDDISCVGGYQHLRNIMEVNRHYSEYSDAKFPSFLSCIAQSAREIPKITMEEAIAVPVILPAYALVVDIDSGRDYPLQALLLNPEASSVEDLTKGIPFVFGNVNSNLGEVCTGSDIRRNTKWDDFSSIQQCFFGFERNYDWTGTWRRCDGPTPATLLDFVQRLNKEGTPFVNQLVDYAVRNFSRTFDLESPYDRDLGWKWYAYPVSADMHLLSLTNSRKDWKISDLDGNVILENTGTENA